jgi:hypothetical protein
MSTIVWLPAKLERNDARVLINPAHVEYVVAGVDRVWRVWTTSGDRFIADALEEWGLVPL